MEAESAMNLINEAADAVHTAVSSETSGTTVRPLVMEHYADSVDAAQKVVETITYRDEITSSSCAAVSGRSLVLAVR